MADSCRDEGFILIVVLFVLAILAVISVGFSRAVQSQVRNASSAVRSAQAEFLADAGVNLVVLDLVTARSNKLHTAKFRSDGATTACRIDEQATLAVTLQDSSGLVNLNLADDSLIEALLIGVGLTPSQAVEYGQRIFDYRDGTAHNENAEAKDTARPKTAGLNSLLELRQVRGLPSDVADALASVSTLSSGTAGLDPSVTPAPLLSKIKAGLSQLPGSVSVDFGSLPPQYSATSLKRYFHVRTTVRLDGQGAFVREADIDLKTGRSMPAFKTWSRGDDANQTATPADSRDLPAC